MPNLVSQLIVKLTDQVSGPAKTAAASLTSLQKAAKFSTSGGAFVQMTAGFRAMRREIDAIGHSFGMLSGITAAGFMHSQYDWDSLLHRYKAITELPDGKLKGVAEQIRKISNETGKMPVELLGAAQGWAELGNSPDSFIKNVQVAARTSRITGISVAEQMKESSALLRAFGFKTSDEAAFKHFEEVYLVASKGMKGGAHAFGEAMKAWAPVAAGLKMTVEEAAAMAQTLGGQFEASEIGNALKTGFMRLAAPVPKSEAALRGAGIDRAKLFRYDNSKLKNSNALVAALKGSGSFTVSKAASNLISRELARADLSKGIDKFSDRLNKKLVSALGLKKSDAMGRKVLQQQILSHIAGAAAGLDPKEFFRQFAPFANNIAFMSQVFGKEHAAKFMDLLKQGEHYGENLERIHEHAPGSVEKKWGLFNDGYAASWDRLRASVQAFVQTSEGATAIGRDMASVMDGIAGVVESLQTADPEWVKFGFRLTALAAAIYPAKIALAGLAASLRLVGAAARTAWAMGMLPWSGAGAVLGRAAASLGRLGAAMTLLGVGGGLRAYGAGLLALLNPLRLVRGAATAARFALRGMMAATGIGALALAGAAIYQNWSKIKAVMTGFAETAPARFGAVGRAIKSVVDFLNSINLEMQGTEAQWKETGRRLGEGLGTAVVAAVKSALAALPGIALAAARGTVSAATSAATGGATMAPAPESGGKTSIRPNLFEKRAGGGPVGAGRLYQVGERGPEWFVPRSSGSIVPNHIAKAAARGGGGMTVHVSMSPTIHGVQDPQAFLEYVERELSRKMRSTLRGLHADVGMRA